MSEPGNLQLRWRGRITGPYSLEEILRQLDDHEIGLWHEVGEGDRWIPLGEYLANRKREQERAEEQNRERQLADARAPAQHVATGSAGGPGASRVVLPPPAATTRPPGTARAIPQSAGQVNGPGKARNRKLFIGLGALLGFTGAHNFYAGYWGTGIVQAVLAIGTTLLGFGFIVSWLWALIELLVVNTDARGRPMT